MKASLPPLRPKQDASFGPQPAAQPVPVESLRYQTGFGNEFATEALPGALPVGQNSPQRVPYGLYAEEFSGTAFTAPRGVNRRTWMYRIRPGAVHGGFVPADAGLLRSAPLDDVPAPPNQLRWNPLPLPERATDFVAGLVTWGANGDPSLQTGCAIHCYAANRSMQGRYLFDADGELLLVPQQGRLHVATELGVLQAQPGEVLLVPRGVRFAVSLPDGTARGYVCENYGAHFRLPELGPIGANGLANPRDFESPVAAYEERTGKFELLAKFSGRLWSAPMDHSPLDVVAWHGNLAPWKYDLGRFMALNTVTFDHADPSIFTVLTSPSDTRGTANVDFVLFPPRWLVAEHTFRPPPFHRNVMSEFMGLIQGVYDGKAEGFVPGGASLHNSMAGHGPDTATFERASAEDLAPRRLSDTLAFMFETRLPIRPTRYALETPLLQRDYARVWQGLQSRFQPPR